MLNKVREKDRERERKINSLFDGWTVDQLAQGVV
jgi:hypothetical protein